MATLWAARSQPDVDWVWAEEVLERRQKPEIYGRLWDGLIQQQQFEIGLEEQPQQVGRNPLEAVRSLEISGKTAETLDPSRLIIEAFGREDIGGKLLILGAPGAGKTTMLLSLAEQLVVGALQNSQTTIPIIFELSTWKDDGQSIRDWLVEQLYKNFGGNRKRKIYEQWLDRGVLLPLLDGLDELGMVRQRKCATQINEFARHYGRLVVCCRVREYEEAGVRLDELRGAVCLQALTDGQIERYLNQVRPGMWAAIQESEQMRQLLEPLLTDELVEFYLNLVRPGMWQAIQGSPQMQKVLKQALGEEVGLLRSPLFVLIAAIIYEPGQPFGSKADLLERYIDRQLSLEARESDRKRRRGHKWAYNNSEQEPDGKTTRHYLGWLATKLKQNYQTELLIEQLQPSWLDVPDHKRQYRLIFRLIMGLITGLIGVLISGLFFGLGGVPDGLLSGKLGGLLSGGLIGLLAGGLIGLLFFGRNNIEPVEAFKISMSREVRHKILETLKFLPGSVLFALLIFGLYSVLFSGLSTLGVLISGLGTLFALLIFGLILVLILALRQELKTRSSPNQGIYFSLQSMSFIALFSYPLGVFSATSSSVITAIAKGAPISTLMTIAMESFPASCVSGGLMVLFLAFQFGGGAAFVQHFCLRFVLACSHSAPWDYVSFLNYCAERRLLQRVGGRYRFLHKELLEHFAQDGEVGSQRL